VFTPVGDRYGWRTLSAGPFPAQHLEFVLQVLKGPRHAMTIER
jgi:hypothetical protein